MSFIFKFIVQFTFT